MNECAKTNACRQLFCFLCCLGVDAFLGAEEAPEKQADSDYRVDERYLDPRRLIAAHAVDDGQEAAETIMLPIGDIAMRNRLMRARSCSLLVISGAIAP